jgi:hypothetical protein
VFNTACRRVLDTGSEAATPDDVAQAFEPPSDGEALVQQSLALFRNMGYVEVESYVSSGGEGIFLFRISWSGMDKYLRDNMPDYSEVQHQVRVYIAKAVRMGSIGTEMIALALNHPVALVNHIVRKLQANRNLEARKEGDSDNWRIVAISAGLAKLADQ